MTDRLDTGLIIDDGDFEYFVTTECSPWIITEEENCLEDTNMLYPTQNRFRDFNWLYTDQT